MWHMQDSHGQILALAFRQTSMKRFKLFLLRSEAGGRAIHTQQEQLTNRIFSWYKTDTMPAFLGTERT